MFAWFVDVVTKSLAVLGDASLALVLPAVFFLLLALAVKRKQALADISRAIPETRTTLWLMLFNIVFITPLVAVIAVQMNALFVGAGLQLLEPEFWQRLPFGVTVVIAIFFADFVCYWRHRLEHSKLLWPFHAVHHSDTAVTWLTLERFHPVNRLSTYVIDTGMLLLLGFPPEVVIANNLVRHYYGYFVHADLPWTYGPVLGRILVSPVMHRWHHAKDPRAYNTNYASIFSLFDRAFGTFYMPGPCTIPLGVSHDMGKGAWGQLTYGLRPSSYRALLAPQKVKAAKEA
ncbi:sterol desaturase family protein [Aestuariispira ectoiniformans]|uniref:sterol desaturase family protein n=1 Tax=Aestuariispira ectoiniformans TaxID=2775080 RepID=UPI00223B1205|nr:sterol desaturase family protein [Aestuariispira ectoiniformans]